MNIVIREFKSNFKALCIWSISLLLFFAMTLTEFSAYYKNPEMEDVLNSMPEAMLKAFSMDAINLTTLNGYLSMLLVYFYLLLGAYAVLLGNGTLGKETRDKTAEFIFSLPVSREAVIFAKILAGILNLLIMVVVIGSACLAATLRFKPEEGYFEFLFVVLISIFIFELIFFFIGMFLAARIKRYKISSGISVSILFICYILSVLMNLSSKIDFLRYLTPFKYFEPIKIQNEKSLDPLYLGLSLILVLLGTIGIFFFYPRRDITG